MKTFGGRLKLPASIKALPRFIPVTICYDNNQVIGDGRVFFERMDGNEYEYVFSITILPSKLPAVYSCLLHECFLGYAAETYPKDMKLKSLSILLPRDGQGLGLPQLGRALSERL